MQSNDNIIQKDLKHIWHPCAQMKDFETFPPLVIKEAKGSYLHTDRGILIDGISSWWCKSLGHKHPRILQAIKKQMDQFEHVIATTTTHEGLGRLGEKLADLTQLQHLFFASDGASAVEIALKLAIHAQQIKGQGKRRNFIALKNAYHGETLGTLGVSDLGIYKKPYEGFGPHTYFIDNIPYVHSKEDPLFSNADEAFADLEKKLIPLIETTAAIIVEPIVQGASGMQIYSRDFLKRMYLFAKKHGIYFIADEIMTGFCRTGEWFAVNHAQIKPDLLCLSKGLTSGTMPLSLVAIDDAIYQLFYNDYNPDTSFLHSHTYSGHALSIVAALATIEIMEDECIRERTQELSKQMLQLFSDIAKSTSKLTNIRSMGAIVAGDLVFEDKKRLGFHFYQKALEHGAYLRPIGNTLYWLPPLNIEDKTLFELAERTFKTINSL